MDDPKEITRAKKIQEETKRFSEVKELNHENNSVSKAQKQMSSQETTGVLDSYSQDK
jgi:hypothetical protein